MSKKAAIESKMAGVESERNNLKETAERL